MTSCLLSKGMAKENAQRAQNARVVDSFMVTGKKAWEVNEFWLENEWGRLKECDESTSDFR